MEVRAGVQGASYPTGTVSSGGVGAVRSCLQGFHEPSVERPPGNGASWERGRLARIFTRPPRRRTCGPLRAGRPRAASWPIGAPELRPCAGGTPAFPGGSALAGPGTPAFPGRPRPQDAPCPGTHPHERRRGGEIRPKAPVPTPNRETTPPPRGKTSRTSSVGSPVALGNRVIRRLLGAHLTGQMTCCYTGQTTCS